MQEAVRATQERLGKFVKRPPLTDKLLRKPPFRFLHDVVTSVQKSNGIFNGLFDENELVSDNVKDRDAKIAFLTKVITVLNATTGQSLTVKPSKIIAGQEPENTNELLQCIGLVLEQNLSTDDAVQQYKQNSKPTRNNDRKINRDQSKDKLSSRIKEDKLTSNSSEKLTQRDRREPSQSRHDASREKDKSTTIKQEKTVPKQKSVEKKSTVSPPKRTTIAPKITKSNSKISDNQLQKKSDLSIREFNENEITKENTDENNVHLNELLIAVHDEPLAIAHDNDKILDKYEVNPTESDIENRTNDIIDAETRPVQTPREYTKTEEIIENEQNISSNSEIKKRSTKEAYENTSQNNKVIASDRRPEQSPKKEYSLQRELTEIKRQHTVDEPKPPSASEIQNHEQKLEPQISKPNTPATNPKSTLRPPSVRPPSARPGAPRLRDKHEDVLANSEPVPMGKVNVIVENTDADAEDEESSLVIVEPSEQQQLEKAQEGEIALEYSSGDHGHLVQQILDSQKEFNQMKTGKTDIEWEFGAQRAREASGQEAEQMRFGLQALSRVANPLGKLLDHIQEDVEVMRQELEHWSKTYEEASAELARQKSSNEQSLQPLQARLKQLDEETAEKSEKIYDLKSIIHKNSARIDKLLASGDVQ